jgi:fimbrial isopeptide formation D2 family protein/LPXTG-motif cell wall-anchored protein
VAVLVLSLGTLSAFADDTEGTNPGSITIKNSEAGTTYHFYRILDMTGADTNNNNEYDAVSYSIAEKWAGFFADGAVGAKYLLAQKPEGKSLNVIVVNGEKKYLNITEGEDGNVVTFANEAMEYALKNNIEFDATAAGSGSDVTKSNLPLGYYLMIPVDASEKTAASSGSVASLDTTMPSVDMLVKAIKPSIGKTDDAISADVGQVVTYTVTGTVPNTAGYETYKYVIKDEMTEGLTFNKDVEVMIGELDVTAHATITNAANGFSADIDVMALQAHVGKTITLTYTATVNESAVKDTAGQEKNKVHLEYGHDPDKLETTTDIQEEVYTAKIVINKYTGDDSAASGQKLAHAKFVLMNSEGKFYKFTAATETAPAKVEWVTVEGAPAVTEANMGDNAKPITVTDAAITALKAAAIDVKETDTNGAAEFKGIKDGTYFLIEVEAPAGYNPLNEAVMVNVKGKDVDTHKSESDPASVETENVARTGDQFDTSNNPTADIQNNKGTELPSTGGIGTTIFYVVGGLLLVGAGVLLFTKKRVGE